MHHEHKLGKIIAFITGDVVIMIVAAVYDLHTHIDWVTIFSVGCMGIIGGFCSMLGKTMFDYCKEYTKEFYNNKFKK